MKRSVGEMQFDLMRPILKTRGRFSPTHQSCVESRMGFWDDVFSVESDATSDVCGAVFSLI